MVWMFTRALKNVAAVIGRRRTRWIEVSLERAWSHDMPARLFDLSDS